MSKPGHKQETWALTLANTYWRGDHQSRSQAGIQPDGPGIIEGPECCAEAVVLQQALEQGAALLGAEQAVVQKQKHECQICDHTRACEINKYVAWYLLLT